MAVKVGIQLYSVKNALKERPYETLRQVAEAGYRYVEAANHDAENDPGVGFGMPAHQLKEILDELGEHQIATGDLIVYTSADSVLQICGSEETMGLEELYRCCEIARELTMRDEWKVGRVIARPYVGRKKGEFVRTANRHDYALKPYGKTVLNALQEGGFDVISVGQIRDIFDGEGITQSYKSKSSVHGMEHTI